MAPEPTSYKTVMFEFRGTRGHGKTAAGRYERVTPGDSGELPGAALIEFLAVPSNKKLPVFPLCVDSPSDWDVDKLVLRFKEYGTPCKIVPTKRMP